jgi:metal-responsive CopG/Arc/MetJ family transcriptional regulator
MDSYHIPASRVARVSEKIRAPGTKAKTSVTIARNLLAAADEVAGASGRSALIEHALRSYLRRLVRRTRHERELALLNEHASRLNAAAARAIDDQAEPDGE